MDSVVGDENGGDNYNTTEPDGGTSGTEAAPPVSKECELHDAIDDEVDTLQEDEEYEELVLPSERPYELYEDTDRKTRRRVWVAKGHPRARTRARWMGRGVDDRSNDAVHCTPVTGTIRHDYTAITHSIRVIATTSSVYTAAITQFSPTLSRPPFVSPTTSTCLTRRQAVLAGLQCQRWATLGVAFNGAKNESA